jgi:hypothetical protein
VRTCTSYSLRSSCSTSVGAACAWLASAWEAPLPLRSSRRFQRWWSAMWC